MRKGTMSYTEYAEQIEENSMSTCIEDTYYMAQLEQWELSDFEDMLD
jgi:hypothetical protein